MQKHHAPSRHADAHPYRGLAVMLVLSFACMFGLMYAMVDAFANVFINVNQLYMAALMTAPMALIELGVMPSMYPDRRKNALVAAVSAIVLASAWIGIRQQAAVGDTQFLRSMIPHHAGAILMCEQAGIRDPDITALCQTIRKGQQAEIDLMKAKLIELGY
jgi:uncharacterized protein (DUF305 family)